MTSTWEELERTCIEDHREISRGYRELIKELQEQDYASVSVIANRLDKQAGPHFEFEEQCLLPEVQEARGAVYVASIYRERRETLKVIEQLIALHVDAAPSETEVRTWTEQLERALEQMSSCGSAMVYLQAHSMEQQQEQLDTLKRLKDHGHRWSELQSMKVSS